MDRSPEAPAHPAPQTASTRVTPVEPESERGDMLFAYGMFFARSGGHRMDGWEKAAWRTAVVCVLSLLACLPAGADSNFTPQRTSYELDGVTLPNLTFSVNGGSVTWSPPGAWRVSGDAAALTLFPPNSPLSSARLSSANLRKELPASPANEPEFAKAAIASLPPLADDVEVLGTGVDPLFLSGLHTVEVTVRYSLNQQRFLTNFVFAPKGLELFRFEITARERDFARLNEAFRGSLYSIAGL